MEREGESQRQPQMANCRDPSGSHERKTHLVRERKGERERERDVTIVHVYNNYAKFAQTFWARPSFLTTIYYDLKSVQCEKHTRMIYAGSLKLTNFVVIQ